MLLGPLTRLAPLATLSPRRGKEFWSNHVPLPWERVPEVRGRVDGFWHSWGHALTKTHRMSSNSFLFLYPMV
jgi:hypothetical protein